MKNIAEAFVKYSDFADKTFTFFSVFNKQRLINPLLLVFDNFSLLYYYFCKRGEYE